VDVLNRWQRWRIVSLDPGVPILIDRQIPSDGGASIRLSPVVSSSSSPGSSGSAQWVASPVEVLRVDLVIPSRDLTDDLRPLEADLRRLVVADPTLRRAPRVRLEEGTTSIEGFVESLEIAIPRRWISGLPRMIRASLSVVAASPIVEEIVQPGLRETSWIDLAEGETLEAVAGRLLGDPLRAEFIRRLNPEIATRTPAAGDRIRVFDADHPRMRGPVRPISPALFDAGATLALDELVRRRLSARSVAWELLPEVAAGEIP
jgi:hypothetical protein